MSFEDAVRSGFDHYVKFDGRATRPAFWWWVLFAIICSIIAGIIDAVLGSDPLFRAVVGLGLFLPGISVSIRRLHDTNRSGWWILIGLIPIIGFIVLLIFYIQEGDEGPNNYGPPMGMSEPGPPSSATTPQ